MNSPGTTASPFRITRRNFPRNSAALAREKEREKRIDEKSWRRDFNAARLLRTIEREGERDCAEYCLLSPYAYCNYITTQNIRENPHNSWGAAVLLTQQGDSFTSSSAITARTTHTAFFLPQTDIGILLAAWCRHHHQKNQSNSNSAPKSTSRRRMCFTKLLSRLRSWT